MNEKKKNSNTKADNTDMDEMGAHSSAKFQSWTITWTVSVCEPPILFDIRQAERK